MNSLLRKTLAAIAVTIPLFAVSQKQPQQNFDRVEPPNWWVGMKTQEFQLLFYKHDFSVSDYEVSINYPGVTLKEKIKVENPHYVFLKLQVSGSAKAGMMPIQFTLNKKSFTYSYALKAKSAATNRIQGFNSSDVVYLVFPDRFANGDLKNDTIPGYFHGTHRDKPYGRHGGDIRGISDHLDYIRDLGMTAIWINPVLENNQKRDSYHGYAITDLYNVDKRFGTNEEYVALIDKAHQSGIKIIQDMVMNHIGNEHWLVKDPPEKNWIHQFPQYTSSNYRGGLISDPYKSKADSIKMVNGWFDTTMPDVNQSVPLFADYLIQNSLWWMEYAGIDGIRMDTYPYPDKYFMARWAKVLTDEYPRFNIVGEVWLNNITSTAYWQKGARNADGYNSYLPSVTDFPFCFAVPKALHENAGWDNGMARLYDLLSQDFQYVDANSNLTFLDNHDMTRFFLSAGKDINKFNMGLTFMLTVRGIPQIYYGTEALMDGDASVHPQVRRDFPGGWANDETNFFTNKNLSPDQQKTVQFMKKLLNWRKSKAVIHKGKLTHYIPQDNVYVYFRSLGNEIVMVAMNGNAKEMKLNTSRFAESIKGKMKAKNVLTDEVVQNLGEITLPPMTAVVLELE
ncbi:neopullulanase SusA [Cytophagales bacterium WSM2-2]|nr:neopullulanase SusA [Cytophagales bacterium WSM2-2]